MKLISKKTLLLFFLPGAIFMGAFLIYPIFKMVFDSFFKVGITGARTFIGFDNYIKAFTAGGFLPLKVILLKSALLTLSAMLSTFYLNYGIIYFIKNIINYFNNYFLN